MQAFTRADVRLELPGDAAGQESVDGCRPRRRHRTSVVSSGVTAGTRTAGRRRPQRGWDMRMLKQLLGISVGLSLTFAGLGATVAFGVFAWIGMPLLALGLGVLSAAIDS